MSSNVGLSTPRGSGTSGYVQRNWAFMKPRNSSSGDSLSAGHYAVAGDGFKQRQPDQQILEHDRRRAVELRVLEERERLEEENEKLTTTTAAAAAAAAQPGKRHGEDRDDNEDNEDSAARAPASVEKYRSGGARGAGMKPLSEEEIEERCDALRQRLLRELEDEEAARRKTGNSGARARARDQDNDFEAGGGSGSGSGYGYGSGGVASSSYLRDELRRHDRQRRRTTEVDSAGDRYARARSASPRRERRHFKQHQVHDLAEAKIEESARLRRALGIKDDWESNDRRPPPSSSRDATGRRDRD